MSAADFAERGLSGLLEQVCAEHHVTADEALGPLRVPHIVAARHALWGRLRALGWSHSAIGRLCDRDPTTVMAALDEKKRSAPRKVVTSLPGVCILCRASFEPRPGRAHCPACHRFRRKCWAAGVSAPRAAE